MIQTDNPTDKQTNQQTNRQTQQITQHIKMVNKTKKLAEIRKLIRKAIVCYNCDKGMPHFYSSENWKRAKKIAGSLETVC